MSALTAITGVVSGVRVDTSITVNTTVSTPSGTAYGTEPGGTFGTFGSTSTSTQTVKKELMNFRVDNRPVNMPVAINLTNGDIATVAGFMQGEFEALAVHNHTTRTMYWVPIPSLVPEIAYIVVGVIWLMFHKFGWILIIGAILFMMNKKKRINLIKDAKVMVQKAPAPVRN